MNTEIDPLVRDERRKVRRRFVVGATVLLFAVVLVWQWNPLLNAGRAWRSQRLAARAQQDLQRKAHQDAFEHAQAAYLLKPDGAPAIATLAKVLSASGRPGEAVSFWQKLSGLGSVSHEDRLSFASDLLRTGAVPAAAGVGLTLEAEKPSSPAVLRLMARLHAAQNRHSEAVAKARLAVELAPSELESQLLLATLLAQSASAPDRELARLKLWELSADQGEHGLQALELLARWPEQPAEQGAAVATRLRGHPKAGQEQRLLALELSIRVAPANKGELLDSAVAEYRGADAVTRRVFGVWLNTQGEQERTVQILPLEESFTRKDLLLVHLDALGGLNRWEDVERLLNRPNVPLEDVYRQVFLARCALQKNDGSKAETHWLRARNAARGTPSLVWFVGGYAEKAGQPDQAAASYRLLLETPATRRAACEALLRLTAQKGETAAIRDLLGEIRGFFPDDPAIENDFAYMNLLTGKELEPSRQSAERLRASSPENLAHRTTLALAHCLLQQPEAAMRAYDGLEIPWEKVSPAQRAIHALVLGMNGLSVDARAEVRALQLDALRPEEKRLIAPWTDS